MGHLVANQLARAATDHFKKAGDIFAPNPSHELRQGLGLVLHLASPHYGWQPDTKPTHDLLASVYEAMGNVMMGMSDEISAANLEAGMLAASRLVHDIDAGTLDGDRYADDVTKTRILTHQLRIAEYEKDMERRRHDRQRNAVQAMQSTAKQTAFFG